MARVTAIRLIKASSQVPPVHLSFLPPSALSKDTTPLFQMLSSACGKVAVVQWPITTGPLSNYIQCYQPLTKRFVYQLETYTGCLCCRSLCLYIHVWFCVSTAQRPAQVPGDTQDQAGEELRETALWVTRRLKKQVGVLWWFGWMGVLKVMTGISTTYAWVNCSSGQMHLLWGQKQALGKTRQASICNIGI